jgi:hypothetical protein
VLCWTRLKWRRFGDSFPVCYISKGEDSVACGKNTCFFSFQVERLSGQVCGVVEICWYSDDMQIKGRGKWESDLPSEPVVQSRTGSIGDANGKNERACNSEVNVL